MFLNKQKAAGQGTLQSDKTIGCMMTSRQRSYRSTSAEIITECSARVLQSYTVFLKPESSFKERKKELIEGVLNSHSH